MKRKYNSISDNGIRQTIQRRMSSLLRERKIHPATRSVLANIATEIATSQEKHVYSLPQLGFTMSLLQKNGSTPSRIERIKMSWYMPGTPNTQRYIATFSNPRAGGRFLNTVNRSNVFRGRVQLNNASRKVTWIVDASNTFAMDMSTMLARLVGIHIRPPDLKLTNLPENVLRKIFKKTGELSSAKAARTSRDIRSVVRNVYPSLPKKNDFPEIVKRLKNMGYTTSVQQLYRTVPTRTLYTLARLHRENNSVQFKQFARERVIPPSNTDLKSLLYDLRNIEYRLKLKNLKALNIQTAKHLVNVSKRNRDALPNLASVTFGDPMNTWENDEMSENTSQYNSNTNNNYNSNNRRQ